MPSPQAVPSRAPLQPLPWLTLPLGSIEPLGWLRDQLRIQANGLSGHLEDVWPSVGADSGWLGGSGDSWERGPYYLDGLVPLAYLLGDQTLVDRAQRWIEWSLASQQADGFFGPEVNRDWWPRMVMLKALIQYQEVTGDARVIPFMSRYLAYQAAHLADQPLYSWAAARGGENMFLAYWLYRRTGDPALLDLVHQLIGQTLDWTNLFTEWPYTRPIVEYHDVLGFIRRLDNIDPSLRGRLVGAFSEAGNYHAHHVVNLAMALKQPALAYLLSGDTKQKQASLLGIEALQRYHGLANHMFSGDEHLSGQQPFQGTELCAIVETLFSLQILAQVYTSNISLLDWAEELAYNSLPAAFSPDMWSHQYAQQPNQVLVNRAHRNWYDNTDDSNLFGLEPHFGCCTANYHQGWPKYVSNLWLADAVGGFAAGAYAPCRLRQQVNGVPVEILEDTAYPFRGGIRFTINSAEPVHLRLALRIPAWCSTAKVAVDGNVLTPAAGTYCTLERDWRPNEQVVLQLPMAIRANPRLNGAVAIQRGPLVYSLAPQAEWRSLDGDQPWDNHEVLPRSPWNYALALEPCTPEESFTIEECDIARQPFDSNTPPLVLHTRARRVPGWGLVDNSAGPLPASPVAGAEPLEDVTLVPYGGSKLRITEFPWTRER
ncbi:MAG: beta-L-arabinofuranosidase domain-containing protein [Anaerolineae bacterium]